MSSSLKIKELSKKEILLAQGHRMCQGCGASIVVKMVMLAIDKPIVACSPTGCLEVTTCISDYTSWKIPWIHSAFENAAATMAGVETMYRSLKKQGKISEDMSFVVFAGDGGTYDIGFQSLSGALERGHDMLYICYDNGAYMNTGIQRSGATPFGASTTTSPAGSAVPGKIHQRKDITRIMAAHNIPYVAQASPSHHLDLMRKIQKALSIEGPKYINILSPCHRGWRSKPDDAIALSRLAVNTSFWPLFEIENGKTRVTYIPKDKRPLREFLRPQGRFAHLFQPENEWIIEKSQAKIDADWSALLAEGACEAIEE
ncbi:MAG: pyruvate ferredoxin oxidoreductase beta subunit [Syntrophaceae bacterium]|nr:MAG: pyruvate ferredoxin oxidoreductase beta subunit [Syntrophaceae bacterium]